MNSQTTFEKLKEDRVVKISDKVFVIAGIKEKELFLTYFIAAELEMFDKYKGEAKKILKSIKFL